MEYIIPAILALVITIGLVRYVPLLHQEFVMEIISHESVQPDNYICYFDLNGDGTSEMITINYNTSRNLAITVSTIHLAVINQFNLPGELTELGATLDLHDIDSNGILDLFFCTEKNDSLFLTVIDDLLVNLGLGRRIKLNIRTGFLVIDPKEIVCCTADGNYTEIVLVNDRQEIVSINLGTLEKELANQIFFRISRSALVNLKYVTKVDNKQCTCRLQGHSVRHRKVARNRLRQLEAIWGEQHMI